MDRKSFRGILRRYLRGSATSGEKELIDSWYTSLRRDKRSALDGVDESAVNARQWSVIRSHLQKGRSRRIARWAPVGIAASVVMAIAALLYFDAKVIPAGDIVSTHQGSIGAWQEIYNDRSVAFVVTLPDQSVITLEPMSRLRFSAAFDERERKVYLEGEAFFEVSGDANRPFLVYANKLTTRVLGTSFRVKAFRQEEQVVVTVRSGRVSVYTHDDEDDQKATSAELILTPNQKVIYDKAERNLLKMMVESPQATIPLDEVKKIRFEATPVKEIFEALERIYGVEIEFDEVALRDCTLTTTISDGDVFSTLDIVLKAIGASYQKKPDRIIIDGKGCD